jgi:hypothetical protein
MPKRISTILSLTVLIAIVVLLAHTEVSAKVCILRIGGTCVFWSGSVKGVLNANKFGDINKPKSLEFTISPRGPGVLYCKSPDIKEPKIIDTAKYVGTFGASEEIKPGDIYRCGTEDVAIVAPVAKLNDTQLRVLDKQCKDPKLEAIDFVPINFVTTVSLVDKLSGKVIDQEKISCTLPVKDPLGWDDDNKRPERRQYDCTIEK